MKRNTYTKLSTEAHTVEEDKYYFVVLMAWQFEGRKLTIYQTLPIKSPAQPNFENPIQ